ncbi:hypothetical protein SLEP1_g3682 [Rubroshorea leprosula]|uniref:Uncharacterized protein n=1 Tax=Rubroshorea leprosula TaxID=152421 RepID=A0AAV5HVT9_9ROSI|nr:hypothetical protein SLEP1_g3682 [Rubroshorea leprosula]
MYLKSGFQSRLKVLQPTLEENIMCKKPAEPVAEMVSRLYRAGSSDNLATRALRLAGHLMTPNSYKWLFSSKGL